MSVVEALLVVVLPFAYGALTRVPFVFAGVHVLTVLGGGLGAVSAALGAYQISRVVGNCLVVLLGERRSLLLGSACGLLGYCSLAATAAAEAAAAAASPGSGDGHTSLGRFVGSLALVGLSEQVTALQALLKVRCAHLDEGVARGRLLLQYACNVCGTSVAFLASGIAYNAGGIAAAARVGAAFGAVLFVGSAVMLAIEKRCGDGPAAQASSKQDLAAALKTAAAEEQEEEEEEEKEEKEEEEGIETISSLIVEHSDTSQATRVPTSREASWAAAVGTRAPLCGAALACECQLTQALSGSLSSWAAAATDAAGVIDAASHGEDGGDDGCWVAAVPPLAHVRSGFQALAADVSRADELAAAAKAAAQEARAAPLEAIAGCSPSWISYVIAVTFCLQALLIGSVLSVAPLIVTRTLGLTVWHVGLAFGAGEAAGSAALLASCSPRGRACLRRALPTPIGLLAALSLLGAAALLLAHGPQSPAAALALLVIIMGLNDVGTSMSGECIANTLPAAWYLRMNALSNVLRRFGNTLTCVSGPLMYGVAPRLPFSLFGAFTLVWAATLAALFARRANELAQHAKQKAARGQSAAGAASVLGHLRRFAEHSFVSSERDHHLRLQEAAAPAAAVAAGAAGARGEMVAAGVQAPEADWGVRLRRRIGVVGTNVVRYL